ncbi:hypothetical protein BGZ68_007170 [Mortierella alpina]|nr:hypothetical protein BGZ68_007170 [Mortierella alpina]
MAIAVAHQHNISLHDRWHSGERKMQDLIHVRDAVQNSSTYFRPFLTTQMQDFVPGLNYFFIGTLDGQGRPWVSILTGPLGFLHSPDIKTLEIKTRLHNSTDKAGHHVPDPLFSNLLNGETFRDGKHMWGGVALDFSNRRRNKMNGVLYPRDVFAADQSSGELHVRLTVEQTIGNCPKYITIREITPIPASEAAISDETRHQTAPLDDSLEFTDEQLSIIKQADCLFISSRFIDESLADQTSGMDCNHRGGNPGFVRVKRRSLVFPDYSGNRFFNTLGNIVNDDRVGILLLSFDTGDTLHLTGRAHIFVGKDAQALYPHSQRCVQVDIEDVLLRKASLPFRMRTKELSPYNPVVPSLQQRAIVEPEEGRVMATLLEVTRHTEAISSFHFETSRPIHHTPGQYAVLDFSAFNSAGYKHMDPENPQSLNDDFIRTWTISTAPSRLPQSRDGSSGWSETSRFTLTIKRKPGGKISNLLHDLTLNSSRPFIVPLISTGGSFTFLGDTKLGSLPPSLPQKVALISGGIGSTPFISMIRGANQAAGPAVDIHWVMSAPYPEDTLPEVLQELGAAASPSRPAKMRLSMDAFLTRQSPPSPAAVAPSHGMDSVRVHYERLSSKGLQRTIPDLASRLILLCGPEPFMDAVRQYLHELDIPEGRILAEDFNF